MAAALSTSLNRGGQLAVTQFDEVICNVFDRNSECLVNEFLYGFRTIRPINTCTVPPINPSNLILSIHHIDHRHDDVSADRNRQWMDIQLLDTCIQKDGFLRDNLFALLRFKPQTGLQRSKRLLEPGHHIGGIDWTN